MAEATGDQGGGPGLATAHYARPSRARDTTDDERARFLQALSDGLSVTGAATYAGIGRRTVYEMRARDPEFAEAWASAYEAGTDAFEDEARRRAMQGTSKPVFYRGEVVGHVQEHSDRLMELFLRARRPHLYRERVDVQHSAVAMTPEQLQAARAAGMTPEVEEAAALLASVPVVVEGTARDT